MQAIPVARIGSSAQFVNAVASVVAADQRGVCVRIGSHALGNLSGLLAAVNQLLGQLHLGHQDADIIIDFGEISDSQLPTIQLAVNAIVPLFPDILSWRTLTLASAGMPEDMTNVGTNAVARATRTDWQLWSRLINQVPGIARRPAFSDYAIAHPSYPQLDFRIIKMGPKIKYTAEPYWLLVKGVSFQRGGHGQYRNLAQVLVSEPEYCGPGYSWGDQYILDCANGATGTGIPRTWVAVGTNHHLTFVVNQIANFAWP